MYNVSNWEIDIASFFSMMTFKRNLNIFIYENAFEIVVCGMAAILSRPQYLKNPILPLVRGHPSF